MLRVSMLPAFKIVCNTTKAVISRVKLLEKPFLKWCKNGQFDLCKNVRLSKTTPAYQWRRQCFHIKSLTPKATGGCQFDNLTLSPFDFPKMIFLEKRQGLAICDFFQKIWRSFLSILAIFVIFGGLLTFPCYKKNY